MRSSAKPGGTHARILQTNYPDILPAKNGAPASCGGIRKEDLDYAHAAINQIDGVIDQSVSGPIEPVDLQGAFGANPLCPAHAEDALANGLNEANVDAELRYLLNLDGKGDAQARKLLDNVVHGYKVYRNCVIFHFNLGCDGLGEQVRDDGIALYQYLGTPANVQQMLASLMGPTSGAEPENVRFDKVNGLFHPTATGHAVQACHVLAVYRHQSSQDCLNNPRAGVPALDTVNGVPFTDVPIAAAPGTSLALTASGYAPNSTVGLTLHSTPVDLGKVTADDNGVVHTTVTLPAAEAGAHTLTISGASGNGTSLAKRLRVTYPGRPQVGGSYATYLTGFQAGATSTEKVDIIYGGTVVTTLTPDEFGGVYVELPVMNPDASGTVAITARSQQTGISVTTTIRPTPAVGVYASGATPDALTLTGAGSTITGPVHSNGGITVSGNGATIASGAEYATTLSVHGAGTGVPDAHQTPARDVSAAVSVADYRPGGSAARTAGTTYHPIPASACQQNRWTVRASAIPTGVVYVPCAVTITGSGRVTAIIAAEGPITAAGAALILGPDRPGSPALLSAATGAQAIQVSGAGIQIRGTVHAPNGEITVTGSQSLVRCGMFAQTIKISGAKSRVEVDTACLPD